jgi:hypothetical protein
MADGSIGDNFRIILNLKASDVCHIQAFQAFCGASNHNIEVCHQGLTKRIAFSSRRLAERLASYGIVRRKSLIARAPDSLASDKLFWLGEIDGDGSLGIDISNAHPVIQLAGSDFIVKQFETYLKSVFDWRVPSPSKKGKISVITAHGAKAVAVIRHLWEGHAIGLPRKRELANEILRDYGDMPMPPDRIRTCSYRGVFLFKGAGHNLLKPWCVRYRKEYLGYCSTATEGALAFNARAVKRGEVKKVNDFRIVFGAVRHVSALGMFEAPPPPRVFRVAKGNLQPHSQPMQL